MTQLVLSRHGQTVWHAENRYAGVSDIDLTGAGRAQAELLARWSETHRPQVVACSPVRRAMETATPSAAVLGVELVVLEDLREVSFGIAEGRTIAELREQDEGMVDRFRADPVTHHFPDAEDPATAADRAARSLRELARANPDSTVLVVAHNTLIRLAMCRLLGIDVRRYRSVFPRLDNGTLTRLAFDHESHDASLLSFNVPLDPHYQTHPTHP